jgi:hypothetical protein
MAAWAPTKSTICIRLTGPFELLFLVLGLSRS